MLVYVKPSPRNCPYTYYIGRPDTIMTHIVGSQMILDGMIPAKLIDRQKRLTERVCRSEALCPIFLLHGICQMVVARQLLPLPKNNDKGRCTIMLAIGP